MEKNKECNIVKDLMPNYIDELLSSESKLFVEEHIGKCSKCKKVFTNMSEKLDEENRNEKNKIDRDIKFAKKYNYKINILKLIIFVIITILVYLFLRNAIILIKLSRNAEHYFNLDNYYLKYYQYDLNTITIIESYNKEGKYLRKLTSYDKSNSEEIYIINELFDGKNSNYFYDNGKETFVAEKNIIPNMMPDSNYLTNDIFIFIKNCILCNIKSVYCNGVECYRLTNYYSSKLNNNDEDVYMYVDKQTGMIVRISGEVTGQLDSNSKYTEYNMIQDFYYSFNSVEDTDLIYENNK